MLLTLTVKAKSNTDKVIFDNDGTNVTFIVSVGTSDCPALQYCDIKVILYYKSTGAEIGSAVYVYGTDTYNIFLSSVDDNLDVCATLQITGNCNYSMSIQPACVTGSYAGNIPICCVTTTCN
jgi:hypothetical protein